MRGEETIYDRALRVLHGSESTQNTATKGAIVPLIPFDIDGADRVVRYMWPMEGQDSFYTGSEEYFNDDGEARLDFESDERTIDAEEFMGDRETIVSLEDIMHLDQLRIGYDEHDIVHISSRNNASSSPETLPFVGSKNESHMSPKSVDLFDEDDIDSDVDINRNEADDILKPICGPIITPTQSLDDEHSIISRLEIALSDSFDSDVSSAFSTTSTVNSTPSMLRLKARKRRLERFLSERSLESIREKPQSFRIKNVVLPTSAVREKPQSFRIKNVVLPTSATAKAC